MKRNFLAVMLFIALMSSSLCRNDVAAAEASGESAELSTAEEVGEITAEDAAAEYDDVISDVLDQMKTVWMQQAEQSEVMTEPYVNITNTRIVRLAENPADVQKGGPPVKDLEGIDYIVEFIMLTNYYGDTYPCSTGLFDSAVVYRDGTVEVKSVNPLYGVRNKYYISDFSGIIETIIDLGDAYSGELFE